MPVGDQFTIESRAGTCRIQITYEELAGHDPDNDVQAIKMLSPVRVAGYGFASVEIRNDPNREVIEWAADFDISVIDGEFDEWRLRPPQLNLMDPMPRFFALSIRSDPDGVPHRTPQSGSNANIVARAL